MQGFRFARAAGQGSEEAFCVAAASACERPHLFEERALVAEQEGEQQRADVRAVHVGIGQDDDLPWRGQAHARLGNNVAM